MSYTCGYLVYGYVVGKGIEKLQFVEEDENITDDQYEAINKVMELPCMDNGDSFGYVGKLLGYVDECSNHDMSSIVGFKVTPEIDTEVDQMVEILPDYVKEVLGKRGIWLTWGSS